MRELAAAISAAVNRAVHPLHIRVRNLVARAVVKLVDDEKKVQLLQATLLAEEVREDLEHFQEYGFTSNAPDGAEGVAIFAGGTRDHGIVLAVGDRRVRLKGLKKGEVAVYSKTGTKILLNEDGDVEIVPSSGKLKLTGDMEISGTLGVEGKGTFSDDLDVAGAATVDGDVDSGGTVTASTDVVGGGIHLKTHVHSFVDADTPSGGSGGTKDTAAPS